ncbi:alkaline serine protease AorO [Paecilomyces variotii No. 5]|uniref:Alkaline serine protease AorO n=1 Tax=Byssochlamys spectabilis (strain No. 5 / NBRC 109023) TaxID=1356009 RepID=V5HXT6_BYSSN|nr:alkaline serine protease AorO [Paecilomyces variotii No. 5]
MRSSVLLLGALTAAAVAIPAPHNYVLHERREVLPATWSEGERVYGKTSLPMRIGLAQSNLDRGHDLLMEVSDHASAKYRQFYTAEEIHDLFAPSEESIQSVRDWLESAGVHSDRITLSANKQWLQFDADAEEVEKLLRTEYYMHTNSATGKSHVACHEYYIPEHVQEHVDYVTPGIKHLGVKGGSSSSLDKRTKNFKNPGLPPLTKPLDIALDLLKEALLTTCDLAVTPECIQAMYNITVGDKATPGNELGIFEDIGDVYSQTDLDEFFATLYPKIPTGTHPTLKAIDGAKAPNPVLSAGPESDLDFQISYPIIWPQNSILFQTDDPVYEANYTFTGFLNNFLDAIDGSYCTYSAYGETGNSDIDPPYPDPASGGYKGQLQCGVYKPTNVISISYGSAEADLPISYQRRQCNEFMKLGLQGVSVLVASGDSGVAGRGGDPTPSNCLGKDGKVFAPDFPATCPYITAVGATYLPLGADAQKDEEVAVTSFPSGGGFSNIYKAPDYQTDAVAAYFKEKNPPYKYYESVDNSSFAAGGGIYNRIGRAYPDVAAIGDNVVIYTSGAPTLIGGTSAASPVFAAILTRINEELIAKNKSTVGFVNPILYAHPEVFNDITVGNNSGCGTPGFYAAKGWDPVTGLGTPNYPALLDLFLKQ